MPPSSKYLIQITIVDDSKSDKCDVKCGVDWSSVGIIALTSQRIKAMFGDKVKLEYLDLAIQATTSRATELEQQIRSGDLTPQY